MVQQLWHVNHDYASSALPHSSDLDDERTPLKLQVGCRMSTGYDETLVLAYPSPPLS